MPGSTLTRLHRNVWRLLLWMTVFAPCFNMSAIAEPGALLLNEPVLNEQDSFLIAQANQDPNEADATEKPNLEPGSSGPLVIDLQVTLTKLGFLESEISGSFDAATQTAVQTFQDEHGLTVSGIVDAATWEALEDPAAAKIAAAIGASEDATPPAEGEANTEENSQGTSPATSARIRTAVMALSVVGIGIGGFGIWKIMAVPKGHKNRLHKVRKQQRPQGEHIAEASYPAKGTPPLLTGSTVSRLPASSHSTVSSPAASTSALPLSEPAATPPHDAQPLATEELTAVSANLSANSNPPASPTANSSSPTAYPSVSPNNLSFPEYASPEGASEAIADRSSSKNLVPPPPPSLIATSALQRKNEGQNNGEQTLTPTTRLARIDVVETLVGELQSHHPAKRRKAIWELGQRSDSRAIQPLVNLMATSDSKQRSLILAALSEIGTQTLKPMKRALAMSLQDENAEVRKNAIRDLTRIYDLVAQISSLLAIATEDQDPEVRETARWALGQLNRIRANAGLDQAHNQQLLKKSVSPPETLSE